MAILLPNLFFIHLGNEQSLFHYEGAYLSKFIIIIAYSLMRSAFVDLYEH